MFYGAKVSGHYRVRVNLAMPDQQFAPEKGLGIAGRSDTKATVPHAAPRVLAVDDDPGMRLLMQETLAKAGFDVRAATSGAEAIQLCRKFAPDLMLLDINMPVMDGITACTAIREQSQRDFPIIMVTSVDDALSIQRAFDAGATDFILKPINWPLFQRRLDSVLAEWNRAQEFDASSERVRLLEKVVPEQVMLVSRNGDIIEDLKYRQEGDGNETATPIPNLEQLYGAEIARRFQLRISGVLKTGRHNNLEFALNERGVATEFEAQFLVEGRDRVIVVVQSASGEKQSQREVFDLAFVDFATGLPNRHLFERCAEEHLTDARLKGRSLVFLSLCFDNMTEENQSDPDVMRAIANRLSDCLARFSYVTKLGKGDSAALVSRVDSNCFMLTLEQDPEANDLGNICDQISKKLHGSIVSGTGSIAISPRLGIAVYPTDGRRLQTVMHAAGSAMHEALETGKLYCFNSRAAAKPEADARDYGNELRRALDDDQLELYYQPRLSMPGGTITCVEALLRWNHPMRGFVDLRELLHLAKATGLIVPLGDWVLSTACEEAKHWASVAAPRVSVNLSQQEFSRPDLADRVVEILERTALDPGRIDLELTEAALLRTRNGLADLKALKRLGVGLVLDDFGTGHSSLTHLKQFPIDALKIDSSFVRDLPGNQKDAAICEVIITMAHLLGMRAVAEGVETAEQMSVLRDLGCDEFQGYHICRPLPANEIDNYLSKLGRPSA